jgi:ribosome-binding ATPase YchF (GTP1/OBG family)
VKSVGLVGIPYSGKSTLFTALTRTGGTAGRANQSVVPVPDPRPAVLARLEGSKKIVPAQVRFVDVPGGATAQGLAALRETDALCVVVRGFGIDADPAKELAEVEAELLLADLAVVEPALENARKRAMGRAAGGMAEAEALERAYTALAEEQPLREIDVEEKERKVLRGLGLVTLKPAVVVANLEEGSELPAGLPAGALGVWAEIEAEAAALPPDEARQLLQEFGVAEPGLERVVSASYRALDLITFLTTGPVESRAWEVVRGATAPMAAGVIHSDMERGFIRAEVVAYDDLVAAGGWDAAKARGALRVEGRNYVVKEGDVLYIRFAV